jgi:hypothetical protein
MGTTGTQFGTVTSLFLSYPAARSNAHYRLWFACQGCLAPWLYPRFASPAHGPCTHGAARQHLCKWTGNPLGRQTTGRNSGLAIQRNSPSTVVAMSDGTCPTGGLGMAKSWGSGARISRYDPSDLLCAPIRPSLKWKAGDVMADQVKADGKPESPGKSWKAGWLWPVGVVATSLATAGLLLLRGCWHRRMSWPVRAQGYSYQVCLSCGVKRLFDEKGFCSYGPFRYDLNELIAWERVQRGEPIEPLAHKPAS